MNGVCMQLTSVFMNVIFIECCKQQAQETQGQLNDFNVQETPHNWQGFCFSLALL